MGKRKKKKAPHPKKSCGARTERQPSPVNSALPACDAPFVLSGYAITIEPIRDYPAKIQKQVEAVYEIVHVDPHRAIEQLERLLEKYPDVPVFCNYMAVAHECIGDGKKAAFWTEENHRRHPDYLIGRINVAEMHLRNGRLDKVEEVLDGKFDMKLLYPERSEFHLTEAVAFFSLVGKYFRLKGWKKQAEMCCEILKKIAPHNPNTLYLKRVLHPFRFWLSPDGAKTIAMMFLKMFVLLILLPVSLLFLAMRKVGLMRS